MLEQYQRRLEELTKESKDKATDWIGWFQIERIEDIISKYTLFEKVG